MVLKVVALCGSLRKNSYHVSLIKAAQQICQHSLKGMEIELLKISELPFINPDLEDNGTFPPKVEAFRQKVSSADSILFATPEYSYSVPATLKNAVDWGSRPANVWTGKTAAILCGRGNFGGGRSHNHLREIGVYTNLHFLNKPECFVPLHSPQTNIDGEGNLIDEQSKKILQKILESLQEFTLKFSAKA
ncbi:hypothetical protein NE237_004797 [Protea cynaroides]|uniref:NAD(P)H dehydrogenase (quinone) n=1 Tax=Protea cynaroides TaxID=273540 RepID=A0A9Q0QTV6_9MAGN|nr:hypothetical protein NE237_004797 [Protea cynaroides]